MPGTLMKSPRELKAFLAQRTVLDPMNELEVLVELLESPELTHMPGHSRVEMLEILWPSVDSLLELFERQLNGTWQRQYYAENASYLGFERLAKLTQQAYSQAALALHHQSKPWWGDYPRETALTRAINLSAQIAVTRLSLYIPFEEGYWHNLYTLWQEIEHAKLLDHPVKTSNVSPLNSKLGEILIGLSIMATLPTNALPSQEIRPLLACFVHFSSQDQVSHHQPDASDEWIGIYFEHDLPPQRHVPNLEDESQAGTHASRYIVLTPLTLLMQEMLNNISGDFIYISDCAVLISRATLERVISHLQQPIKPRRERPKASGQCYLYSGISVIHHLLQEGIKLGQFSGMPELADPQLVQAGIDTPPDATNLIADKTSEVRSEELWDLVGRGHLIYEPPRPLPHDTSTPEMELIHQDRKLWSINDVSVDGIHLSGGQFRDEPILSIGSLVLVEFPKEMTIDYLVGILRWELNPKSASHEIGIETLAHEAKPIRVSGSHQNTSEWYDGLLLPPSRRSEQPLLVLPNQEYRIGASVMILLPLAGSTSDSINQHEPMREYILGHKTMQTTSICVFQFKDARELTALDSSTDDNQDVST